MIKKPVFLKLIKDGEFERLFTEELGWDRYKGRAALPTVSVDCRNFRFRTIADRNGFQIIRCDVNEIPTQSLARKVDSKLRRQAEDYICIFRKEGTAHDLWMVPVRANEKRELVMVEYTDAKAEVIYQKIEGITFDFSETTNIVDLRQKVQGAFVVNSEKITKDFYSGFRKEHKAFAELIRGIDDHITAKDNRNKQWYASVMLNRLMFCYFIQKKGFLNLDTDYLRHKLDMVQSGESSGSFYNFYRSFLRVLFHDGLNTPNHDRVFEKIFGRIPYLNGGMFDQHHLEREFPDIDIPDEAFRSLFDFFDKWNWHLDTRLTASGKDINPDVLGYIFEQYINDRAQMGAYYTKEDITEYIGKNCILPFLMDRVKDKLPEMFGVNGYVWTKLKESGDRYIYDAVRRGYSADWRTRIPAEIAKGIITDEMRKEYSETPVGELKEDHEPLAELRKGWNRKTPEEFALPTEIWRETIERFERCDSLHSKISKGEIQEINDFITLNLDIRSFVFDLLNDAEDHRLVGRFYKALQSVSILDPTCGSGAFLFAAMNILEPLYEVCIERMQEFNARNPKLFKDELAEISNKYRSNIQYFIFKSIILRNLYGVDIMVEATEIAKLRLFLKMVAVVDVDKKLDNLGLDPLPDIDFNIRCGNTLVGYANEKQLIEDLTVHDGDWVKDLANQEFKTKIDAEMRLVAMAYERFRRLQLVQEMNMSQFKEAKHDLRQRLKALNELLNRRLFEASGQTNYTTWLASHQPFNWLAEFYQIIHDNGGFDVIIGNPPYVTKSKKELEALKLSKEVVESGNLFSAIVFRCHGLKNMLGTMGMIVQMSFVASIDHRGVRNKMEMNSLTVYSSYDIRPAHLFDGVNIRLAIFLNVPSDSKTIYTEKEIRWYSDTRGNLFSNLSYHKVVESDGLIIRYCHKSQNILRLINCRQTAKGNERNVSYLWIAAAANNFIKCLITQPRYSTNGVNCIPSGWIKYECPEETMLQIAPIINSSIFHYLWRASSDGFHVTKGFVDKTLSKLLIRNDKKLQKLGKKLEESLQTNSRDHIRNQKTTGITVIQLFEVKPVKSLLNQIDTILAHHYGLTEEELDFIINYDIKYRMGDELNAEGN